jgi:hypothetical protein
MIIGNDDDLVNVVWGYCMTLAVYHDDDRQFGRATPCGATTTMTSASSLGGGAIGFGSTTPRHSPPRLLRRQVGRTNAMAESLALSKTRAAAKH